MKSIFKQEVYRKVYKFDYVEKVNAYGYPLFTEDIVEKNELIEVSEIGKCDLDDPVLNIGDDFYVYTRLFSKDNEKVKIKSVVRNDANEIIYFVNDKIIEDDRTNLTKEEAENDKKINDMKIKIEMLERNINSYKEYNKKSEEKYKILEEKYKNKKWYQCFSKK